MSVPSTVIISAVNMSERDFTFFHPTDIHLYLVTREMETVIQWLRSMKTEPK